MTPHTVFAFLADWMDGMESIRHDRASRGDQHAHDATDYPDLFPEAGITPAIGDALRGPYLRWYVFYAACFEPALVDKAVKREPGPVEMLPYGDLATTLNTLTAQLSKGPWLLGDRFTSADVLWGTALTWMTGFGLVEAVAPIRAYVDRWNARPSGKKVAQIDADLLKPQGNA